jgi:NAD(P)-dependent dehydrogenase (short-subunit alcohol dehydrogenase family)
MKPPPAAIVTGAGRGIGRATAQQLSKCGYRLMLVSRSAGELEETSRLCENETVIAAIDVRDPSAVEQAIKQFGRVDALVHAAGLALLLSIEELTLEQWHDTLDTNLSAAFYFCKALWPIWRNQGGGTAVFVSSEAARNPFLGLAAYGAAKAGLNLLGLSLAREGAEIGLRVHIIAPGAVETAMLRSIVTPSQLPVEKTLDPADVANMIVQCVRGELRYTSGETIYVHKTI